MNNFFVAATGHRPNKLNQNGLKPYSKDQKHFLVEHAKQNIAHLLEFLKDKDCHLIIIQGMAQGWDQAVGVACYTLNVPYIAAIPYKGHGNHPKWPQSAKDEYQTILDRACKSVLLSNEGFSSKLLLDRNIWMVDRAHAVLALYNGDEESGTAHCINYAKEKRRMIFNSWESWVNLDD